MQLQLSFLIVYFFSNAMPWRLTIDTFLSHNISSAHHCSRSLWVDYFLNYKFSFHTAPFLPYRLVVVVLFIFHHLHCTLPDQKFPTFQQLRMILNFSLSVAPLIVIVFDFMLHIDRTCVYFFLSLFFPCLFLSTKKAVPVIAVGSTRSIILFLL